MKPLQSRSPQVKRPGFALRLFKLFTVYFAGIVLVIEAYLVFALLKTPTWQNFAAVLLHPYITPLLAHRIHNLFAPLREGRSFFGIDYYSPWLTSHRFQLLFITFPVFEKVLLIVPGLFNMWLRAWGSHVGKGVLWVPNAEVLDRSHMHIEDNVAFANRVYLSPHVVRPAGDKKFLLYFKKIHIGTGSFIGAGARIGPGAYVAPGTMVPLLTDIYLNQRVDNSTFKKRKDAAVVPTAM